MRNLKDFEINIVSGGVPACAGAFTMCLSATEKVAPTGTGHCTGGNYGKISPGGFYYCLAALSPNTEAQLNTVLGASSPDNNYCDAGDTNYGSTTETSKNKAGTGSSTGVYSTAFCPG
ncbi:hypothetical protein GAMM_60106 [Gammaproteobacteria bacterium]